MNRYPIYIISKGRYDQCLTAQFLIKDGLEFKLVVEPQEKNQYADKFGSDRIHVLPFSNLGLGSIPARNWCWENSIKEGHEKHWILDDNIKQGWRKNRGKRIICNSKYCFHAVEEFTDRYENIAISGCNYDFFGMGELPPFYLNVHVYSNLLIRNDIEYRWRGRYNEDTDFCLQVLSGGWCTVLFNAFLMEKRRTMTMKGGNTDVLYKDDGRLKMARSLERVWGGVVETRRKFQRPQHHIKNQWTKFDTPLIRRTDIDWSALKSTEYGMEIQEQKKLKTDEWEKFMIQENKRLKDLENRKIEKKPIGVETQGPFLR